MMFLQFLLSEEWSQGGFRVVQRGMANMGSQVSLVLGGYRVFASFGGP